MKKSLKIKAHSRKNSDLLAMRRSIKRGKKDQQKLRAQLSPDMILKPGVGQSLSNAEYMQFMRELTQMTQGMSSKELKEFMLIMEGIRLP